MAKENIGFVGVGMMGHGMAKNLLAAGYPVTVIAHANRAPVENLVGKGAREAATLAEARRGALSIVHNPCAPEPPRWEGPTSVAPPLSAGVPAVGAGSFTSCLDWPTSNP